VSPESSADPLDLMFRRLVENLSALDPAALHRPIAVADIHQRLVPYRTHRALLGLDSGEDYEMTVLRLLAGEGGYAMLFPEDVREAVVREVVSPNPDTGMFRNFPDATVMLVPEKIGDRQPATADRQSHQEPAAEVEPEAESFPGTEEPASGDAADDLPFVLDEPVDEPIAPEPRPREVSAASAACQYCGGNLPVGRTVLFCPHCGQNVGVVHCPTCDSELDVGWQYCITCGQKVTGL